MYDYLTWMKLKSELGAYDNGCDFLVATDDLAWKVSTVEEMKTKCLTGHLGATPVFMMDKIFYYGRCLSECEGSPILEMLKFAPLHFVPE